MTKDIVRELRLAQAFEQQGCDDSLSGDATDEIERLRSGVKALINGKSFGGWTPSGAVCRYLQRLLDGETK